MGFVIACTITFTIMLFVACIPTQAKWLVFDPFYTGKYHCIDRRIEVGISTLSGACSVLSDLYSVILPAALLSKLQVPRRQKIGLYLIFGLGFL